MFAWRKGWIVFAENTGLARIWIITAVVAIILIRIYQGFKEYFMAVLGFEIKKLLDDPQTIKVLASVDGEGRPYVTFKGSFHLNDRGQLEYFEFIESSRTNKNLVSGVWFNRSVAVNILGKDKSSFQIIGRPVKALISGREFEGHYRKVKEDLGLDLSTVWIIEADEVIEETFEKRKNEEALSHPLFRHLDWFVKD
jgi:hypothetical protein